MSEAAARPPNHHRFKSMAPDQSREIFLFNEIATITAHTLELQDIANLTLETVLEFFQISRFPTSTTSIVNRNN